MENNKEKELVKEIINLLQNGVLENDNIRPFDMLDYYRMTKRSPRSLYEKVVANSYFSEEERKLFYSFVCKSFSDKRLKINDIIDVKHFVLKDDVPVEITELEKMNVIKYLEENKIPITSFTYNTVLSKYLANDISFEEKEKNKLLVR